MLLLLFIRNVGLVLCLVVLAGCAELNPNGYSNSYNNSYRQSELDELLTFGDNMAKIPSPSRVKVCRTLLTRQNNYTDPGVLLHLMIGRLLSDSCGDIPKIQDGIASIPPARLNDEQLRKLIAINMEALKRMSYTSKKAVSLERKQKKVQSVLESKDSNGSKDSSGSKNDEARLLREKLEAIRSMEKHLDESGDAN
jgi:hypothetical protein